MMEPDPSMQVYAIEKQQSVWNVLLLRLIDVLLWSIAFPLFVFEIYPEYQVEESRLLKLLGTSLAYIDWECRTGMDICWRERESLLIAESLASSLSLSVKFNKLWTVVTGYLRGYISPAVRIQVHIYVALILNYINHKV